MRILYVNVVELHAGWGAEWFVDRAFAALSVETHCIDFHKHRFRLSSHFLAAPPCHVFFLQRGDWFPIPLIRAMKMPRLFWASELVSRCRDQDRLLRSGLFDHVFMRTPACIDAAVTKGWLNRNQCSVFLSGFDPAVHRRIAGVEQDIDVLFVGSLTPRRRELIERLQASHGVTVQVAFGEDLVQLFARAKIILNIHAEDALDTETRVYETLGCGRFLLSETLSSENPFGPDEVVQWSTFEELQSKIDYYLAHPEEREGIAEAGHRRALAEHTYEQRARQILETMVRCGVAEERWGQVDRAAVSSYQRLEPFIQKLQWVLGKFRGARLRAKNAVAAWQVRRIVRDH